MERQEAIQSNGNSSDKTKSIYVKIEAPSANLAQNSTKSPVPHIHNKPVHREKGLSRMDRLTLLLTRGRETNDYPEQGANSSSPFLTQLTKNELEPSSLK